MVTSLNDYDWSLSDPFMSTPRDQIPGGNDVDMLRLGWEILEAAKLKSNAAKAAQYVQFHVLY